MKVVHSHWHSHLRARRRRASWWSCDTWVFALACPRSSVSVICSGGSSHIFTHRRPRWIAKCICSSNMLNRCTLQSFERCCSCNVGYFHSSFKQMKWKPRNKNALELKVQVSTWTHSLHWIHMVIQKNVPLSQCWYFLGYSIFFCWFCCNSWYVQVTQCLPEPHFVNITPLCTQISKEFFQWPWRRMTNFSHWHEDVLKTASCPREVKVA